MSKFRQIFCTCCLWLLLGPPLTAVQCLMYFQFCGQLQCGLYVEVC